MPISEHSTNDWHGLSSRLYENSQPYREGRGGTPPIHWEVHGHNGYMHTVWCSSEELLKNKGDING